MAPWDKTEGSRPQKGRYRNQAEFVVWGPNGARPLAGPVAPGVFRIAVPQVKHHITGKPMALMTGLLEVMEGPILDPFVGSAFANIGFPLVVEAPEGRAPIAEPLRQIAPRTARSRDPQHRLDELPVVPPATSGIARLAQTKRLDLRPLRRLSEYPDPSVG